MSQKTLLFFFKSNDSGSEKFGSNSETRKDNKEDNRSDEDSPIKAVKISNKKRNRISSSDSESSYSSDESKKEEKPNNFLNKKKCINNPEEELKTGEKDLTRTSEVNKNDIKKYSISENDLLKKSKITDENGGLINKNIKNVISVKNFEADNDNTINNKLSPCEKKGEYDPTIFKYDPIKCASWNRGERVPYYALARTLEEIEKVSGRLKMIDILSNYLRSVIVLTPDDLLPSIYLCLNKLGPPHEGFELGLAEQTLIRSISLSTGRTVTQIRNEVQETGDLGVVAEKSRSSQRLMFQPAPHTVAGIFKKFREISKMSGQAAVNKKIIIIQNLFVACKGPEARFLIRSLNGKLRIGLAEQSVLQAVALACTTTPPGQDFPPQILDASKLKSADAFKSEVEELTLILKTTYCECPNYELIIPALLRKGIRSLPEFCKVTPGLPMKPMLAHPTKGIEEVLMRFEGLEFTCEWKYDGERAQIHCTEDGIIKIYSRNQEDNTSKYPDIISRINHTKKESVNSFILDCEAVAWDSENKRILPFQVLSTRKRKDASEADIKVPVCLFMFDLLYLNKKPLIRENLYERRRLLRENFNQVEGEWMFASSIDSSRIEEVQEFLEESVKGNCEGLMIKTLKEDATYEIAKRSRNWLKLKKDYLDGVGDTLDLTVMGGYLGKGKRTGTYGGFLVGCYDDANDEYQSVCKLGTGFSDGSLVKHTEFFKSHVIPKAPSYYQHDSSLEPDHWFEPIQVWEIKCADLSLSPVHRAGIGMVDPEKGISLRFPRFLRIRDDKRPEEGTTAAQIIDMYNNQEQVKSQQSKRSKFSEEDFY